MAADTDTRWHPVAAWLNATADDDHAATQFATHALEFTESHPAAVARAFRDARLAVPPPHTPDGQYLYPAQIGVRCDRCGAMVVHDCIVTPEMTYEQLLDVPRAHLRAHGWDCRLGVDLCPTHARKPAAGTTPGSGT